MMATDSFYIICITTLKSNLSKKLAVPQHQVLDTASLSISRTNQPELIHEKRKYTLIVKLQRHFVSRKCLHMSPQYPLRKNPS